MNRDHFVTFALATGRSVEMSVGWVPESIDLEGWILSDDVKKLQQRVAQQKEKLGDAVAAIEITQARCDASTAAYEQAEAERERLKTSLKLAKRRARRLAKEAKSAHKLARVSQDDRDDAMRELDEHRVEHDKRAAKLTKAEAALAAASKAEVGSAPTPRTTAAAKKAPVRKAPAQKAAVTKAVSKAPAQKAAVTKAVKKAPVTRASAKKAPVKKAPVKKAPAKKTS